MVEKHESNLYISFIGCGVVNGEKEECIYVHNSRKTDWMVFGIFMIVMVVKIHVGFGLGLE